MAKWTEGKSAFESQGAFDTEDIVTKTEKSARHPPNQERSIYEWLDLVTDLGAMVKSIWEPIWSRWMVILRSICKPVRNRSIVDLVSIWDRFEVHLGSIWDRFGFRLGDQNLLE